MFPRGHLSRGDRLVPGKKGGAQERLGTPTDRRHNIENAMRITNTAHRTSVIVTIGRIPIHQGSARASTATTVDTTIRLDRDGAVVTGLAAPLLIGIILGGLPAPWPELRVPRTRVSMAPTHMLAHALITHLLERVPEDGEGR